MNGLLVKISSRGNKLPSREKFVLTDAPPKAGTRFECSCPSNLFNSSERTLSVVVTECADLSGGYWLFKVEAGTVFAFWELK